MGKGERGRGKRGKRKKGKGGKGKWKGKWEREKGKGKRKWDREGKGKDKTNKETKTNWEALKLSLYRQIMLRQHTEIDLEAEKEEIITINTMSLLMTRRKPHQAHHHLPIDGTRMVATCYKPPPLLPCHTHMHSAEPPISGHRKGVLSQKAGLGTELFCVYGHLSCITAAFQHPFGQ